MKEITPRTEPARLGLAHAALTGLILEVFYEVYNELGSGFLESVYRRAFKIALEAQPRRRRGGPHQRLVPR